MEIRTDEGATAIDPNLQTALAKVNTPPEEAAQNIDRAKLFEVNPDAYKGLKEHLDPQADAIERTPAEVAPITEQFVKQSEQHASLAKDDLNQMSFFEKRASYYKAKLIDLPDLDKQITELSNKEISDGKLEPGEEEQLKDLNLARQQITKDAEKIPDIGGVEKFGVDVAGAVKDFGKSYWDNKEILVGTTAAGAGMGSLAGSLVPGAGTAAGAIAGGIEGAVAGSTLIGFIDGYTKTKGMVNNELKFATNDKGEPLNLPLQKRANVSQGVAIISGVAQGLAGKVLARSNPVLQRFISPQMVTKLLANSAEKMAQMEIIGGVIRAATAQGGAQALGTVTKIVGEHFAKMDESEGSFNNALNATVASLQDPETLKQAGLSFATGAATGAVISGAASIVGKKGLTERFQNAKDAAGAAQAATDAEYRAYQAKNAPLELPGSPEQQAKYNETTHVNNKRAEILEAQNNIIELAHDVKDTKVQKYAPQEMNSFTKGVFRTLGMGENFFFHMDNLRKFADTPEKGAALRKVIDPDGRLTKIAQDLNTPLPIAKADLLPIIAEFPEITDHMRVTPDGESPEEARTNAQAHKDKLVTAAQKREEILSTLGVDQPLSEEQSKQLSQLSQLAEDPNVYNNKNHYVESQSFSEVPGVMTTDEAVDFNTKHLNARLAVADSLTDEVDGKFGTIENRIFKDVDSKDLAADIKRLDTEFKVLDKFKDTSVTAHTVQHEKKGFSSLAIDPKSLPEDLKAIYWGDPKLKERKVFVQGGLDIEESAALAGVDSGEELLRILAKTPSRKEIVNTREQRQIELRNRINQTLKPTRLHERDMAFDNLTQIHLKEMEHMRTKEWPTTKRGIVKIASPVPRSEDLNQQAVETVSKIQIKDLNPNLFKQGESKTQKAALQNFLNGEFEQAFENKGKAALNNEMRKEALKAQDKITKYQKFWKTVNTPNVQQELKDAGYLDAMNEFTEIYKLDGAIKNETKVNAFNKWVERQAAAGQWVPAIPERLSTVQASYKDLTLEQYQTISEMGQNIVAQAKLKNKLLGAAEARAELKTMEMIAEDIDNAAKANIKYDAKKAIAKNKDYMSKTQQWHDGVKTALSSIKSLKTIVADLDEQKMGGTFHKYIGEPIKAARNAKRFELQEVEAHDREMIEKFYGVDNFKKKFNEFVAIPEFKNIPTLGDGEGNIRKVDLFTLQAYMGDPEGRASMKNFVSNDGVPLSPDIMKSVLEQHLDDNDAAFVQNFLVNRFKRFEQRSFELHKRTTGIEPDMVHGVSVTHNGKVLPGGYYPVKRQMLPDAQRAGKFLESLKESGSNMFGEGEGHFFAKMRSAEMTQQGRLKDRTGSERPLSIKFENVFDFTEEAIHDLHFRETGINTLKILKNPLNVENIKSVVGPKEFANLLNSVKDVVSKTTERETTLFGEESGFFETAIQKGHSVHAVMTIGLNLTSAMIQVDSLPHLALTLGPKAGVYLLSAAKHMSANLSNFEEVSHLMGEINPDILFEKDNVDNAVVKQSYEFIPTDKRFFKNYNTKTANWSIKIKEMQASAIDNSFALVREMDHINKILATKAISEMFLNGDVEGYPTERINAMSDADRAKTLRSVVQQAIDISLTASAPEDKTPMERFPVTAIFTRYWTDRRSRLNRYLSQGAKIKGDIKRGNYGKAVSSFLTLALVAGGSRAFVEYIRNQQGNVVDKLHDDHTKEEMAKDLLWHFLYSPIDQGLETIPGVDAVKYAAGKVGRSDYKNVSTPLLKVGDDFATGISALGDVLQMAVRGKSPDISDIQRKALLNDAGYLMGGAPTNGIRKIYDMLDSNAARKDKKFFKENILELHKNIDNFIKVFKDEPDAETFINDLKEYQKTLPQFDRDVKNLIPEHAEENIRTVLSDNKWNKVDPKTGAAGIYQFTEQRWNEIMRANPSLGLTDNGRVSKDPAQQQKAMNWSIQDNARGLMAYEVPVTNENLLGAHKFGFDNFLAIYQGKDNQKLSEVLKDKANDPVFEGFKTVGEVKNFLKNPSESKGRGPASVPDGWGRSVVNGEEILTPPSKEAESNKPSIADLQDQENRNEADEFDKQANENGGKTLLDIDPNPDHWIGINHVDDLKEQWKMLQDEVSKKRMDDIVKENQQYLKDKSEGKPTKGYGARDIPFLAAAINYGRSLKK